jgi:hypothetical protein
MGSYPVDRGDLNPIYLVCAEYRGWHHETKLRDISGMEVSTGELSKIEVLC